MKLTIQRRLARSGWSVATGLIVLILLLGSALLLIATAPLWLFAGQERTIPDAVEVAIPEDAQQWERRPIAGRRP
jgi:hypothetical protein